MPVYKKCESENQTTLLLSAAEEALQIISSSFKLMHGNTKDLYRQHLYTESTSSVNNALSVLTTCLQTTYIYI